MRHFVLLSVMMLALAACSSTPPKGQAYWPDRESLVGGEEITVQKGENVYAIARKYNVPMREIIVLNDLKPPYGLKVGQTLSLPLHNADSPNGEMPQPAAAPRKAIESAPLDPVRGGAVTAESLPPPSGMSATNAPLSSSGAYPSNQKNATSAPVALAPAGDSQNKALDIGASSKKAPLETTVSNSGGEKAAAASDVPDFKGRMPLQGPVVAGYGTKPDGASNDGINIGAPKGSPVVASAGGIVVYSGNEMKGFGNLILIRHEGGWVTAYAHLDRMLVTKDAIVAAGDQIATVGTSGGVTAPQLHFETRYEGKPVDPQSVLKN